MQLIPGPHKKALSSCESIRSFIRKEVEKHKKNGVHRTPQNFTDVYLAQIDRVSFCSGVSKLDLGLSPHVTYQAQDHKAAMWDSGRLCGWGGVGWMAACLGLQTYVRCIWSFSNRDGRKFCWGGRSWGEQFSHLSRLIMISITPQVEQFARFPSEGAFCRNKAHQYKTRAKSWLLSRAAAGLSRNLLMKLMAGLSIKASCPDRQIADQPTNQPTVWV